MNQKKCLKERRIILADMIIELFLEKPIITKEEMIAFLRVSENPKSAGGELELLLSLGIIDRCNYKQKAPNGLGGLWTEGFRIGSYDLVRRRLPSRMHIQRTLQ